MKGPGMVTTSGTYSWPFVTQIFDNGQPSYNISGIQTHNCSGDSHWLQR
jgi:hypothetical protein